MPQAATAAAAAEIPKPAAIKMRLTCDNDLYFGSFYGRNYPPPPPARYPLLPCQCSGSSCCCYCWCCLPLLLLPPLAWCIFKSGFSLFVRFTNRKIASDYTTCSVCSPFWCGQTSPPVLAFFSPPSCCLFLFLLLLLLLLLLFLLLLLLAGINIAAFIYAVYICTLPSPTSCKLLPLFLPLSSCISLLLLVNSAPLCSACN